MKQLIIFGLLLFVACSTIKTAESVTTPESDAEILQNHSYSFQKNEDLKILFDQIGNSSIVLLGESSHGTSEFYYWRAEISKYLIQKKGFNLIAIEGDWSEAYKMNQFINRDKIDSSDITELFKQFNRWPTWLWANKEMIPFLQWMNSYNQSLNKENKIGIYGVDLFSIGESLQFLNAHVESDLMPALKQMQTCFQPYQNDVYSYRPDSTSYKEDCSAESLKLWQDVLKIKTGHYQDYEKMQITQNARVILNGEKYLRIVRKDRAAGWNIREQHMFETIKDLMRFKASPKIIIWAHNTHVGDAHYTDMGSRGKTNLGELIRSNYGKENVFIVGFGSNLGTVAAVEKWGSDYQQLNMPAANKGSWEDILHQAGKSDKIILSKDILNTRLNRWIDQRAVGIVYHPKTELSYVPSIIPKRYDAFIYINQSSALQQAFNPSKPSPVRDTGTYHEPPQTTDNY